MPLQFWFCRNVGLALPLIALQYHEVKVNLWFRQAEELYISADASDETTGKALDASLKSANLTASLWVDYIYLDTDERRRFAQVSHEYLIEQLQFTGEESSTSDKQTVTLSFNHPVKELVWCYQNAAPTTYLNSLWNFSTDPSNVNVTVSHTMQASQNVFCLAHHYGQPTLIIGGGAGAGNGPNGVPNRGLIEEGPKVAGQGGYEVGPLHQFKLILNGQDRFKEQLGKYFNQYQPYLYHTGTPYTGIYVYSFALRPEEHQPSGTCNFSRIDKATLQLTVSLNTVTGARTAQVRVYALNYNVLRVMSGMGGLAYSN